MSKTGTNTPPYTSWQTAADSIQKCINICVDGDTIYVANGVYKERIDMIPGLSLIGSGMDSCIVDTRQLAEPYYSIRTFDSCYLNGIGIYCRNVSEGWAVYILNSTIEFCKIQEADVGFLISTDQSKSAIAYKNIIFNVQDGIICEGKPLITENIISANGFGLISQILSNPIYLNNIIMADPCYKGFSAGFGIKSIFISNLIIGFGNTAIDAYQNDSIFNNAIYGSNGKWDTGIAGANTVLFNNHIQNTNMALYYDEPGGARQVFKYNNLWKNEANSIYITIDSTNIFNDPMFVNEDSMDFHLQMYSPLIDAGDPNILDKDGSRSDIGIYGGPYGDKYTYRDLAPKPPSNLTVVIDSGLVKLTWNKNTEADFSVYRVYRDTVPDFMYDTTKIVAVLSDTVYYDDPPQKFISGNYYYKITALDNTLHQSAPSEEAHINITGIPEAPPIVVEHYRLLNNYPNPFNSSTIIPYRLKEGGYVKLYIYDMKGELVRVLVNGYQSAGYYEVRFNPSETERAKGKLGEGYWTGYNDDIASGMYIYQLHVRGEGDIPVFTDMGKMILLK
ncbi:MAG: hypothetical protein WAU11_14150 [Ignavibacteriaceae bacterium]